MEIPSKLDAYSKPTLLIVSSHDTARALMINEREVEELKNIHTSDTDYEYSDKEGFSHKGNHSFKGKGTVPGNFEKDQMHYDKVFANYLTNHIESLYKKYKPEQVLITLPEKMIKIVLDKLPQNINNSLKIVTGNYINMPLPELLEALDKK